MTRIGVLGSGQGTNFSAIADACRNGRIDAEVALVVSDVADAGILRRARKAGIEARHLAPGRFRTKLDSAGERRYIEALREARVEWIVLAGFMRILHGDFLRAFPDRVVNIHPSLLPSFPGREAWEQALAYGVKVTGCTVHLVDQGIDTGPILAQRAVEVLDPDDADALRDRIQAAERLLYPEAIAVLVRNGYRIQGRRTSRRARAGSSQTDS